MRALETGRWMVRSTNTGASAAIDERGRVVSRLPLHRGTLVEKVSAARGMTPYARLGKPAAILAGTSRARRLEAAMSAAAAARLAS
jgi:apolipoprotein N-acyltransferase